MTRNIGLAHQVLLEMGVSPIWVSPLLHSLPVLSEVVPPRPVFSNRSANPPVEAQQTAVATVEPSQYSSPSRPTIPVTASTASVASPVTEKAFPVQLSWKGIQERVGSCEQCARRTSNVSAKPYFGLGIPTARYMLISDRVLSSFTFQGKSAGTYIRDLMQNWFAAAGIHFASEVFATHALKCPDVPASEWDSLQSFSTVEGVQSCRVYLTQQIQILQPEKILVLGRFAAQVLFNAETPLKRLSTYYYQTSEGSRIPVVVSFPVRHLLENPLDKAKAWQDMAFFANLSA